MEVADLILVDVILLQKRDSLLQILLDLLVGLLECTTRIVGQDRRDTLSDIGNTEVRRAPLTIEVVGEAEDIRQLEVRPSAHGQGFTSRGHITITVVLGFFDERQHFVSLSDSVVAGFPQFERTVVVSGTIRRRDRLPVDSEVLEFLTIEVTRLVLIRIVRGELRDMSQ